MKPATTLLLLLLPLHLLVCRASGLPAVSQPADRSGHNKLRATPNDIHALIIDETAGVFRQGTTDGVTISTMPAGVSLRCDGPDRHREHDLCRAVHTSRVIVTGFPFNELIPSWNVDVPPGSGFVVELRVGRGGGGSWTPFYYLGSWGDAPGIEHKVLRDAGGVVEIDYFRSRRWFDRIQYRVHLAAADPRRLPALRRFALAYSNTLNDEQLARRHRKPIDPGPRHRWARRLPVPFRSQKGEGRAIRGRVCSPTATAMVMAYRGVNHPTARVCEVVWDAEYEIFGNWARAVQGAYTLGVPGYVERFGDLDAVKRHIANDQPIIASIRAAPGQLRGAPYRQSSGHLLVIVGFDADGNVHVNDPAGATSAQGVVTYAKEDMEKVWLANGGVGYVLVNRGEPAH